MKKTFGGELRRMRREVGLNLVDLAKVLDCSIVYVSDIERDRRNPPPPKAIEALLRRIGRLESLGEMLRLAAESRKSIEIPLTGQSDPLVTDLLVALARKVESGELTREVAERIRQMMDQPGGQSHD